MSLSRFSVVLPFEVDGDRRGAVPSTSINAVASTASNAVAVARVFTRALCRLRYRRDAAAVRVDRARVGEAGAPVTDAYCYALGGSHRVQVFDLPRRLEGQTSAQVRALLTGLRAGGVHSVIIDAAVISYVDSQNLGVLAGECKDMQICLFRPPAPIRKVFEIVGLDQVVTIHEDLRTAVDQTIARLVARINRHKTQRLIRERQQAQPGKGEAS
jgi:anti-anti-sigma factor